MNPFVGQRCDLGTEDHNQIGDSKDQVDNNILHSTYSLTPKCDICKGIPSVRLIPKKDNLKTLEMEKGVCVCLHCLQSINSNDYGIRVI